MSSTKMLTFCDCPIGQIRRTPRTMVMTVLFYVATVLLVAGCGPTSTTASSTSVPKLVAALRNLQKYDLQSCQYTAVVSWKRSLVPAPSDTRYQLSGFATLSEASVRQIRSGFEWKAIDRGSIPKALLAVAPATGEFVMSEQFNRTFESNSGAYWSGFVLLPSDSTGNTLYFLVHDDEHLIQ